jgi:uncharacterized protein with PQ loop repeat
MTPYEIAELTFAIMGFFAFSFQLAPQAWLNYTLKSTHGLSTLMIIFFVIATTILGGYSFATGMSIMLKLQPPIFLFFCFIILGQVRFYGILATAQTMDENVDIDKSLSPLTQPATQPSSLRRKAWIQALAVVAVTATVSIGAQIGIYYLTISAGPPPNPTLLTLSLLTPISAFIGFMPQFYEIYKLKRVVGISLLFLIIDGLGGVFNIVSLIFLALATQEETGEFVLDVPAVAGFAAIALCDFAILMLYPILEKMHRKPPLPV